MPLIDYIDTLLGALNQKAKTKKACKKKGLKGTSATGATPWWVSSRRPTRQFGDFDNDPGPDGIDGTRTGLPAALHGVRLEPLAAAAAGV